MNIFKDQHNIKLKSRDFSKNKKYNRISSSCLFYLSFAIFVFFFYVLIKSFIILEESNQDSFIHTLESLWMEGLPPNVNGGNNIYQATPIPTNASKAAHLRRIERHISKPHNFK